MNKTTHIRVPLPPEALPLIRLLTGGGVTIEEAAQQLILDGLTIFFEPANEPTPTLVDRVTRFAAPRAAADFFELESRELELAG